MNRKAQHKPPLSNGNPAALDGELLQTANHRGRAEASYRRTTMNLSFSAVRLEATQVEEVETVVTVFDV